MITTVNTTTTTATAVAAASLTLVVIVTLLALLIKKEIIGALEGTRAERVSRGLNIAIVPLAAVFVISVVMRVVEVIR